MFQFILRAMWLVVAAFLACDSHALATNYYVGGRGDVSDRSSGKSPEQSFASISRAIDAARPGDRIVVFEGDYRNEDSGWGVGVIPVTQGGLPTAPLHIQANGEVLVSHFVLQNVQHVHIEGFTFRSQDFFDDREWQDMPAIVRDLPAESLAGVDYFSDWESRRETIEKSFATYFGLIQKLEYKVAIDVQACKDITIADNAIDGYWAGIQCRGVDGADIRANRIRHCQSGIFTWEPRPALANARIRGNIVSQCLDIGIDIRRDSHNVVVEWNRVNHCGVSHIGLLDGTRQSTVRYNAVSGGGYYSEAMQYPGSSAINLNAAGDGCIVEFNLAANQIDLTEIDGNGIIVDLMREQARTLVRGNLCIANMGSGLNTTASPRADIYGNIFLGNGLGGKEARNGAGIKLSRNQDIDQSIMYNLFIMNRAAGILSYHTLASQRAVNRNFYWTNGAPIVWDGYEPDERAYHRLPDLRKATGWELQGLSLNLSGILLE